MAPDVAPPVLPSVQVATAAVGVDRAAGLEQFSVSAGATMGGVTVVSVSVVVKVRPSGLVAIQVQLDG